MAYTELKHRQVGKDCRAASRVPIGNNVVEQANALAFWADRQAQLAQGARVAMLPVVTI